jgi:hypothetical protein
MRKREESFDGGMARPEGVEVKDLIRGVRFMGMTGGGRAEWNRIMELVRRRFRLITEKRQEMEPMVGRPHTVADKAPPVSTVLPWPLMRAVNGGSAVTF